VRAIYEACYRALESRSSCGSRDVVRSAEVLTGRKKEQEAAMALGRKEQCREGEDAKANARLNFTPTPTTGTLSVEVFLPLRESTNSDVITL
jgi:hypothetical protein